MKKQNYITLYADEFAEDIWEEYCKTANVPTTAQMITIYFNDNNVVYRE